MASDDARPPAAPKKRRRARVTFATRLIIGGLAISLGIILSVSTLLLVSRVHATQSTAATNSRSRGEALRELLQQVTEKQARQAAVDLATLRSLQAALADPQAASKVPALFTGQETISQPIEGDTILVFDRTGAVLVASGADLTPLPGASLPSVASALQGQATEGVEMLSDSFPAYDFAQPVHDTTGTVVGAVLYVTPLEQQLYQLLPAIGIDENDAVWILNQPGKPLVRLHEDQLTDKSVVARPRTTMTAPATLESQLGQNLDSIGASPDGSGRSGFYSTPDRGDVVASLWGLNGLTTSKSAKPVLYVGAETDLTPFIGNQQQDVLSIIALAAVITLVTVLAVLIFVHRFVRRPVARLSEGVTRIADGDYSHDIPVTSEDELGALALQVNRMRAQIESNIRHIDAAVTRLGEVSRALTTTTAGVGALETAVCSAAAAMAGGGAAAYLMGRRDDSLTVAASNTVGTIPPELDADQLSHLFGGETVRRSDQRGDLVAVPMFYQQEVRGALVVSATKQISDADTRALTALANNAAIALENTRLFEQERETVRRLRELDAMKSDFLSTAQHELRTPVTAIMGQLELIRLVWPQVDDGQKLGIIDDIEISTRMLRELLETIIDFSLVNGEKLLLRWREIDVRKTITEAVDEVTRHFRDGDMPVTIDTRIGDGARLMADPDRFRQVIRCLLDNAVKFTPKGGRVVISARQEEDHCIIEVVDTGIGIDPSMHQRIFERFFQVDNTGTRSYGGMGMGLALVQALCLAHGATVGVESELDHGSRFTVRWPAQKPSATEAPQSDGFHLVATPTA